MPELRMGLPPARARAVARPAASGKAWPSPAFASDRVRQNLWCASMQLLRLLLLLRRLNL